jgi:signal transduction histidine kinase
MGRLFWKFFFFFWLAQLVTSIGVGVTMWLLRPDQGAQRFEHAPPPPPAAFPGADRPPPPPFDRPEPPPPRPGGPPPHERSMLPPLMPLLAGSVVSLLFAALLAWYFARPIRSLRQAFESAAGGRLETRIGASMGARHDELADLGADFDRMAERLQGLVDGQRRLLHDVSHELRSPLARLQAAADLMRQQPERGAEFVERIERDTGRMDRLVGELLTLARLDAGMTGTLDEAVDLHELIGNIAEDAHVEAEPRHCRVDVTLVPPLVIAGSRDLVHRAVENVVRNALRHSPDGGCVSIVVKAEASPRQVRIEIADEGSGVAEAELDAIFEPFFRGTSADAFSGYGLGLAITRRIVEAHGGSVSAANRSEGGLVVTLLLPAGVSASR